MASQKDDAVGEQTRGRYMDEFTTALKNLNSTKRKDKNKEIKKADEFSLAACMNPMSLQDDQGIRNATSTETIINLLKMY